MTNSTEMVPNSFELEGILFEGAYTQESILAVKNFEGRPDDVHLSTYPRTGTTWTQNILVGLCYGTEELERTGQIEMRYLFPYLEIYFTPQEPGFELAKKITKSPRLLKNHLSPHLAPNEIFTQKRKNIVVLRNPKDTALSLFKFYQTEPTLVAFNKAKTLPEYLELFYQGKTFYSSWWKWSKRWVDICRENTDNNLLIHYEDLHNNFEETVHKMVTFLGLDAVTSEDVQKIKELTAIDNMKTRYEKDPNSEKDMVNKGELNGWKAKFPQEYVDKFDQLTNITFLNDDIASKFV